MKRRWLWAFQIAAAVILLPVSLQKLFGTEMSRMVFEMLGMEPHGRILVGLIELGAALLLLSPLSALGALLTVCIMLGAIIAHVTVLGVDVGGDGGRLLMMLVVVFLSSVTVLLARRRELPIIGFTMDANS